jgi:hypothetical protein
MKYLQDPQNLQNIVSGGDFGSMFNSWIEITKEKFDFEKAKNKKLADLSKFYNSSECWTYTLFSNLTKTYASLTGDTYFFGRCIPASLGKEMEILDDNNVKIMYFLDKTKGENLNFKINNPNARIIKEKKLELENKINLANNIEDINSIDLQKELLNAVERKINLDII